MRVTHLHRIGGIGGSERHLLTLLPALAARGVDVHFVGLDDTRNAPDPFYVELDRAGIPYERLTRARSLARAMRRSRPGLVHTHLVHADVYGSLVPGAAVVSSKHNPDPFRAGPWRFAERALARRAVRIIAISEAVRRFSVDEVGLPAEKIDVVHYGLDSLPQPWAESPQPHISGDEPLLLCVARLAPQKGVDVALHALRGIPRGTLLVLGEGPERARLETLGRELGVADRLLMPGRLGDVAALYRRADVVVHPARWEGFGLAMLEAMLAAKPVVAANAASAPELVVDGVTGLLVAPDDPTALAVAATELLEDRARADAYGRAGRERAQAEFSVERMAAGTIAVYEAAAG